MVTARRPNDGLYRALCGRLAAGTEGAPKSVRRIGDWDAPAIIAAAVYAGHRYARELDSPEGDPAQVPRDRVFGEMP
jgi:dimethylamine/trimethylamine dehydrogenase